MTFTHTTFRKAINLFSLACMLAIIPLNAAETNLDKNNLAIEGYDPVSYFSDQPAKGSKAITATHSNATYYFNSEENRDTFVANPEKYIPAYGGWCAWAMLEGDTVPIDPLNYKVIDGKNYLYYKGFWGDTRQKWNEKIEETPEPELVSQANTNWSTL